MPTSTSKTFSPRSTMLRLRKTTQEVICPRATLAHISPASRAACDTNRRSRPSTRTAVSKPPQKRASTFRSRRQRLAGVAATSTVPPPRTRRTALRRATLLLPRPPRRSGPSRKSARDDSAAAAAWAESGRRRDRLVAVGAPGGPAAPRRRGTRTGRKRKSADATVSGRRSAAKWQTRRRRLPTSEPLAPLPPPHPVPARPATRLLQPWGSRLRAGRRCLLRTLTPCRCPRSFTLPRTALMPLPCPPMQSTAAGSRIRILLRPGLSPFRACITRPLQPAAAAQQHSPRSTLWLRNCIIPIIRWRLIR